MGQRRTSRGNSSSEEWLSLSLFLVRGRRGTKLNVRATRSLGMGPQLPLALMGDPGPHHARSISDDFSGQFSEFHRLPSFSP